MTLHGASMSHKRKIKQHETKQNGSGSNKQIEAGSNALQLTILIHLLQPRQISKQKRPLDATPDESSNVTSM